MANQHFGYAGKLLRVDLSTGKASPEPLDEPTLRKHVGGTGLGVKILYEEVPPSVGCFDAANRLILASGPLGGSRINGSGTYSLVTLGALTNGATATQANGFFGAYLRFSGFDGLVVQGAAKDWVYLYIHDGQAEVRDARQLLGLDTFETEDAIKKELQMGEHDLSVVAIGPAGENRVRFAMVANDRGHVAAHNGPGAVFGSKKLKAIAVARKGGALNIKDSAKLTETAKELFELAKTKPYGGGLDVYHWGTLQVIPFIQAHGMLPTKNYQTNAWDISAEQLKGWTAEAMRTNFGIKRKPCWACQYNHCFSMKINEGPYAGKLVEEPEYEGLASCGPVIGNKDVTAAVVLNDDIDRMGMDVNETGWVLGFAMECYEKGLITKKQLDGLDLTWGNVEAARALVGKIARREGIGNVLAEGVMRAARQIGGEAVNMAVHSAKGNSPRTHDHRISWFELFETCVSSSGTIGSSAAAIAEMPGVPQPANYAGAGLVKDIPVVMAKVAGATQFEDSLGVCNFNTQWRTPLLCQAVNAATGWDITFEQAMDVGRRAVNTMRTFNLRRGIKPDLDKPSPRYGSAPADGPLKGVGTQPMWNMWIETYYGHMGWSKTGIPLPQTLEKLGLGHLVADLP